MVVFGQEAGGDVRALSLIHATRVLIIVTLAPFIATHLYGVSLSHPIGAPAIDMPPDQIGLMLFAALAGWKGAEKLRLFGASILGPMIATAILTESSLSFLGLGDRNLMSWGFMIGAARTMLREAPLMSVLPGIAILLTVLAINLIGEGLNDAMNPQLRKRGE